MLCAVQKLLDKPKIKIYIFHNLGCTVFWHPDTLMECKFEFEFDIFIIAWASHHNSYVFPSFIKHSVSVAWCLLSAWYYQPDLNKHEKSSPGPSFKFVTEAKLNNFVYFVYTLPAVCTVQLINTWHQAGLSRGFVDYYENGEQIHTQIHRHTSRTTNLY